MKHYDVVIVGAGPAGLSCAYHCQKNNLSVAVIEKTAHPRLKVCGGGLSYRALKNLPITFGPETNTIERTNHKVKLSWLKSELTFYAKHELPIISMTMRENLDAALCNTIRDNCSVYENQSVDSVDFKNNQHIIKTSNHIFSAKFVIIADGASGKTAELFGWKTDKRFKAPAVEAEIAVTPDIFNRLNEAALEFESIVGGYAWCFPKTANHLSIGVGQFSKINKSNKSLNESLREYINQLGIKQEQILNYQQKGFVIPLSPRTDKIAKHGVFLVGDSAGLVCPLSAEGISYALQSGRLAAEAIFKNKQNPEKSCVEYISQVENEILANHRVAATLANVLYNHPQVTKTVMKIWPEKIVKHLTGIFLGKDAFKGLAESSRWYKRWIAKFLANTKPKNLVEQD